MDWESRCRELQQRVLELEKENRELREKLGLAGRGHLPAAKPMTSEAADHVLTAAVPGIDQHSGTDDKVRLFRSIFRGREDAYARRWYSVKSGKSGYSPVCANEWKEGVCPKPRASCAQCDQRVLVPLSDKAIYDHLSGRDGYGRDVVGIYPILEDETCWFLAIDLDDAGWQESVSSLRSVCQEWSVPCGVERSRSGEGAHLWILFAEPISCATARKLGALLLTAAMERDGKLKLEAYDRMFPCQDTLPKGGFGNLIALPLQGLARRSGNSVFVDDACSPYPDQWAYLAGMERMTAQSLDNLLRIHSRDAVLGELYESEAEPELKPWEKRKRRPITAMDFCGVQQITRANMLFLPLPGFSPRVRNRLMRLAAFQNPEFYRAQAMRLPVYNKPRIVSTAEERNGYLALPRGCESKLLELLEGIGVSYEITDRTFSGKPLHARFLGELREDQQSAADALLEHDTGVLSATTAFGKTVVAAYLIAQRKVNTLILVHTQSLLDQWKRALAQFLAIDEVLPELPKKRGRKRQRSFIGQLGGTKNSLEGFVDVAIMQSLISGGEVRELVKDYGMVIADECHHVSAVSFERILKEVNARYVYGLTATPTRKDGHHPIIYLQCGPIRYQVDAKVQAEKRSFSHAVIPRFTTFARPLTEDKPWTITDAYRAMQTDKARNAQIVADVTAAVAAGRTPLVLTERYEHAKLLHAMLAEQGRRVVLLSGRGTAREKRELLAELAQIPPEEPLVLVATGRYVGEGFDLPRLDTLMLTMPISWKGTLAQYAGRLHREYAGKREVLIYDYVDLRVPMLERMYQRRLSGYAAIGYSVRGNADRPVEGNRIFSQEDYLPAFAEDIRQAEKSVVVVSPYLQVGQVKRFLSWLPQGIEVQVVTGDESCFKPETERKVRAAASLLEERGVLVRRVPKQYQRFAVIDRQTLWYGGINFLGFERGGNGSMRLCSPELARELLRMLNENNRNAD